ncbi:MAG: hypothetical protein JST73_10905 [Actinobacteria bacterium]|nr:hypothetical protein [Actinomycetota bacterium]
MPLEREVIGIEGPDDLDAVLAAMRSFTEAGAGWCNVQPDLAPGTEPPSGSVMSRWFRRNSPDAALGTWMAPPSYPQNAPATIGIQHGLGVRTRPLLGNVGSSPPESWRCTQDSPRRGLVLTVPADAPLEGTIRWLLGATAALTRVETLGSWTVTAFRGRKR